MNRSLCAAASWLPALLLPALAGAQQPLSSTPAANQLQVAPSAVVAATYGNTAALPGAGVLKVFSAQRGGLRSGHSGATAVAGSTVSFQPTYAFQPGEVVAATAGGSGGRSRVWQFGVAAAGSGRGYFAPGSDVPVPGTPGGAMKTIAGDVDNDGDLDLLAANLTGDVVNIRLNDGTGQFSTDLAHPDVPVRPDPYDLALGDLDGDGDLDLVTANVNDASVSIRLNDGTGRFSRHPVAAEVAVGYGPNMVVLGDLDGDGDLDLATPIFGRSGQASIRLNNGSGVFTAAPNVPVGDGPLGLALADVDNDGDLDLAVSNSGAATVSIRLNSGAAVFGVPAQGAEVPVGTYAEQMALRDLDGDGDADLLVTNNSIGTVSVRLNNGQGLFTAPASGGEVVVGGFPKGLALGDVDADGDLDFVVNTNQLALYLNDGQAGFSSSYPGVVGVPSAAGDLSLADVDGDDDLDLLAPGFGGLCYVRLNGVAPVAPPPAPLPPVPQSPDSVLTTLPPHGPDSLTATPNPARGQVYLSGLAPAAPIELLDLTGRVVYAQPAAGSKATLLLPATVVPGVYVLRSGSRRRRIILE